jgi:hypothetical protein
MKVLVIVKASNESEAGVLPDEKLLTEMTEYNEELVKAGVMLAGEGLHPSSNGARVRFGAQGKVNVTPGPFPNASELVAGFWIWQVKSKEDAIAWLKKAPFGEGAELEIRQVFDAADFGEAFTPELRQKNEIMQQQMDALRA